MASSALIVSTTAPKRENLLLNLAFNIALPALILSRLSKPEHLGPLWGLLVALAFPLAYGVWDFQQRRQTNFISVIGFLSVLLTGGLGLLKMDGIWFAVKEAAVPAVIAVAVVLSMRSPRPLVQQLLLNDQVMDLPRIRTVLAERTREAEFQQLLRNSTYWLVAAFLLSAVLNFALARYLLKSPSGTPEFNAELARMTVLSWPVIVIPSTGMMMFALWRLIGGIRRLTGLHLDEILRAEPKK